MQGRAETLAKQGLPGHSCSKHQLHHQSAQTVCLTSGLKGQPGALIHCHVRAGPQHNRQRTHTNLVSIAACMQTHAVLA